MPAVFFFEFNNIMQKSYRTRVSCDRQDGNRHIIIYNVIYNNNYCLFLFYIRCHGY